MNPAQYGLVVVTSSEGRNLPYGRLEDILSRDTGRKRVIWGSVLVNRCYRLSGSVLGICTVLVSLVTDSGTVFSNFDKSQTYKINLLYNYGQCFILYVFWPPGSASGSVIYLYESGSGPVLNPFINKQKMKKNLDSYCFVTSL